MKSIGTASILDRTTWTAIIVGYFAISLSVGLLFSRRAGRNLSEYFVSGRSLPWWIAGTSMVATTFAADTPLAVTSLTAKHGLAGNWFWFPFALGGMITVFVYAKLRGYPVYERANRGEFWKALLEAGLALVREFDKQNSLGSSDAFFARDPERLATVLATAPDKPVANS